MAMEMLVLLQCAADSLRRSADARAIRGGGRGVAPIRRSRVSSLPWHDLPEHSDNSRLLVAIMDANRHRQRVGIFSVCSASRFVMEACMLQARRDDSVVLLESTSNQVNQFGGYTGMTPADFRDFANSVAADMNFPQSR